MNAGLGFHRRLRVESIFDAVALLRNRKNSRVHYRVERIALLLRAHPVSDGEIVINVEDGKHHEGNDEYSFGD